MWRSPSTFDRSKPKYKPQPRVLVLCEDSKSSKVYLQDAAIYFRAYADVEVAHCGRTDPQGIVAEAIARQHSFEEVYCVIDRDGHEKFNEAIALASPHPKVTVRASHPCYEFWLLLHFRKTRKEYASVGKYSSCDVLARDLMKEEGMHTYTKGDTEGLFDKLVDRLPVARIRAAQIWQEATADGGWNPTTTLHELIGTFEELGRPKQSS
jgi:hypothetical protein